MAQRTGIVSVDFEVHGRVQGVFFRASTEEKARCLGLTGWVMNSPTGTVKGQVQGVAENVAEMKVGLCASSYSLNSSFCQSMVS